MYRSTTDRPPLAAEIRDEEAGRLAALQTVPTQETFDIQAGEYQLQVSVVGRLSETYQVQLQRGQPPVDSM